MEQEDVVLEVKDLRVFYGAFNALRDISMEIPRHQVTALIGPSGCGKSTFLRCFNRMNDLIAGSSVMGQVLYRGNDIYAPAVDATRIRSEIGMVFQKPNPFPKSIFENVAFGLKINGFQGNIADAVRGPVGRGEGPAEQERLPALRRAAAAPVHRPRPRRGA